MGDGGRALAVYAFDDFELDAERLELRHAGNLVKVNRTALMILVCLVREAGRLVSKDELVAEVWEGRAVTDAAITVATARLRKALKPHEAPTELFESVYGRGYRFLRPVTARACGSRPPPALVHESSAEPPFVGRERVLHRLRQALAQAQAGRGCMCALIGEPGIGKTRAVEVFERELQDPAVLVSWGFCPELGETPPLAPWRQALRPALARLGHGELEASLGGLAADLQVLMQDAAMVDCTAEGPSRGRFIDTIASTVALAAESAPLVIVLDDLHCADGASLELLARLVDGLTRTRLLIVATLRPTTATATPASDAHLRHAVGHRNCERIVLEPLRRDQVEQYIGAVIDDRDARLGRAVFDKSEGNPFFMTELARQLLDMAVPGPDALAVPQAALELMRQRIARLDARSRSVLTAAAVIGRSFELGVLQDVTESDAATLMEELDEALGAEVLVAAPDSMTAFAFGHELMRAALYDALPPGPRRRLHLKTAQALERRFEVGESVQASELAFHFHRALPAGDPRKTVRHCRAAAGEASLVFANAEVARYMRHALEALDLLERPSARLRMTLLQAQAMHTRTSDPHEFRRAIDELVRLAIEHHDGPRLVLIGAILNPAMGLEPDPRAADVHARALAALPDEERGLRAIAHASLAATAPHCFDTAVVEQHLGEALALAEAERSDIVELGVLPCRLYLRGGPAHDAEERAVRHTLEELVRRGRIRTPMVPGELAFSRAITALQRRQRDAALDAIERAEARFLEMDQREGLWHARRARVLQRLGEAPTQEVAAALAALHALAEEQSLSRTEPFRGFDLAVVLPELGRPAVLDGSLRRLLAYDASEPPSVWSMKVRALATAGFLDAAHEALRAVPTAALARLPCDRDYLGTLGHLVRAALQLGARDYVEALYPLLEPYPEHVGVHVSFYPEGSVAHLLGVLAAALGRHDQAIAHLEAGVALEETAGLVRCADDARRELSRVRGQR